MTSTTNQKPTETHLSERLDRVASLVPSCRCLFDIGTDHGFLPIQLLHEHRCQIAVAADIRPGPLGRAARHIREAGLGDKIETRLTDGLRELAVAMDDVVVIAGLGGNEIRDILAASHPDCLAIILQPMKSAPELRIWLYQNGYTINEEILAIDRGRYYPIMRCVRTGRVQDLDLFEAWVGPVLLRSCQPELIHWLSVLRRRLEKHSRSQPDLRGVADRIATIMAGPSTGGEISRREERMSDKQTDTEIDPSRQAKSGHEVRSDILVRDVMLAMETLAPAELAESWDRIGLQAGDPASPVSGILIALDLTPDVLRAAHQCQANLIICHHPVIFTPILTLRRDDPTQSLLMDTVLAHCHVFSAHTNLDAAPGGVADAWAGHVSQVLGVQSTPEKVTPYGRLIVLDREQKLDKILSAIAASLPGSACRSNMQPDRSRVSRVRRIAAFPGSFPLEVMADLIEANVDTVICGECKYHDGLTLALAGIAAISVGHDHSEQPVLGALAARLAFIFPQIPFAVHNGIDYNKQAD